MPTMKSVKGDHSGQFDYLLKTTVTVVPTPNSLSMESSASEMAQICLIMARPMPVSSTLRQTPASVSVMETVIVTMPNYFADYDTTVHFITSEEMKTDHSGIPHGGFVIRSGKTGINGENQHIIEYSLKLDSNPEFTASVLTAFARAAYRLYEKGESGCMTAFDIAPKLLSEKSPKELIEIML